jgi:hypothetical protein
MRNHNDSAPPQNLVETRKQLLLQGMGPSRNGLGKIPGNGRLQIGCSVLIPPQGQ